MPAGRPSIYGLYDSNGELRYIGKANNPEKRLEGHRRNSKKSNTPLYLWVREGGVAHMGILEENCEDWQSCERLHIAEARARGCALFNVRDGGNGASASFFVEPDEFRRLRKFSRRHAAIMANAGLPNGGVAESINRQIRQAISTGKVDELVQHINRTLPWPLPN